MPYLIGFLASFFLPIFKALFDVFFSKSTYIFLARIAVILSMLTLFVVYVNFIMSVFIDIISFFVKHLDEFKGAMNGNSSTITSGGRIMNCIFYYIHFLGLDVAITSFLAGLFSLGLIYFLFKISSLSFTIVIKTKQFILKSLK